MSVLTREQLDAIRQATLADMRRFGELNITFRHWMVGQALATTAIARVLFDDQGLTSESIEKAADTAVRLADAVLRRLATG